jgi:ferritin-like metal-binding protein YciE
MTIPPTKTKAIGCPAARADFAEKSENHEDFLLTHRPLSLSFANGQSSGRGNLYKNETRQSPPDGWLNLVTRRMACSTFAWQSGKPLSPPAANILAVRFTALKLNSLRDLFIEELRDLYSAETQLIGALPKMAEAASSQELASAFEHHLGETRGHISRLESIFKQIGEKSSGETCEAMKGLLKEGEILVKAEGDPDVRDAGLIGAAQRVEHYEMAGYGTARSLAQQLGENQMAEILQETLNEEGEANKKLTSIAERQVNVAAAS